MTNSERNRWDDERLDRLASAVESNTRNIESNTRNIDVLVGIAAGQQERMAAILEEIRDIKVEIRGLQTENRRILDHLFGQQEGE